MSYLLLLNMSLSPLSRSLSWLNTAAVTALRSLLDPGPYTPAAVPRPGGGYIFISIYTDLYAAGDSTEGCCHGCLLVLRLAVLEAGELVVVVGELAGLGRHQGVQVRSLANFNIDTVKNTKFSEKKYPTT